MAADAVPAAPGPAKTRGGKRVLVLLAAVCVAPVLASYAVYYLFPRGAQLNYGALLPTSPAPPIEGIGPAGVAFRLTDLHGRWVLLIAAAGPCEANCERALYATRQARTMQGKDHDRIVRVLLTTGNGPSPEILAQHPGLVVARVGGGALATLPGGARGILLVDPLGNLVLSYPEDPDIKGLAKDLTRLLRASGIG